MKPGRWSESWALIHHEVSAGTSRHLFWFLRSILPILLFIALALVWIGEQGLRPSMSSLKVSAFGERIATALCLSGYVISIFLGPVVVAGALEEQRRTGMLELLMASPLSVGQIFFSIVVGRLITAAQCLVAASPLLLVPLYFGGLSPLGIVVRALLPTLLGASLSICFTVSLASMGMGRFYIGGKLLSFLTYTPLAFGFRIAILVTLIVIFLPIPFIPIIPSISPRDVWYPLLISFFFPYCGLAMVIVLGPSQTLFWGLGSGVAALLGIYLFLREGMEGFSIWTKRSYQKGSYELRSYKNLKTGGWRKSLRSLQRRWGGEDRLEGDGEPIPSLARVALSNMSGTNLFIYRMTGRNALVAREILTRRHKSDAFLYSIGILAFSLFFILAFKPVPSDPTAPAIYKAVAVGLSLLLCAFLISQEGSQLLPTRSQRALSETLLSTPISGWDFVLGGAGISLMRIFPILGVVFLLSVVPWGPDFNFAASLPSFLLFCAALLFAYGLSLWAGLLLKEPAGRVGASFATFVVLLFGLGILLIPSPSALAACHPVVAWMDSGKAAPLWLLASTGTVGLAGAVLAVTFASSARKLAR